MFLVLNGIEIIIHDEISQQWHDNDNFLLKHMCNVYAQFAGKYFSPN